MSIDINRLAGNCYDVDMSKSSSASAWLIGKYLDWQRDTGALASMAEFARYLEVGDKALNTWINGRNNPSYKKAVQICKKLGDFSLLEVLGYAQEISLSSLPPELQALLRSALLEIEQALKRAGAQADSMEALEISKTILKKHGFSIDSIEMDE